jgi:hypothetical protein
MSSVFLSGQQIESTQFFSRLKPLQGRIINQQPGVMGLAFGKGSDYN